LQVLYVVLYGQYASKIIGDQNAALRCLIWTVLAP
jgi:hypothetical protein